MRIAVAGWIGSTNLGDELIFSALSRKLVAHGADVVGISIDPGSTKRQHPVDAIHPAQMALAPLDGLVFGGGEVLQDETSIWNLPYHLTRVWSGRLRRLPTAVVGVGAVALRSRAGGVMVRRSLSAALAVTVRDRPSLTMLRRFGLDPVLAADPVLALRVEPVAPDRLVVSLRRSVPHPEDRLGRLLPAGRSKGADPGADWVPAMAAALDRTAAATGLVPRFVAMQRGRDDLLHEQVAATMSTPSEQTAPDLAGVMGEIARGVVVVAMRYHGGVAALAAARPSVLIGYSPKVAALAAEAAPATSLLPNDPAAFGLLAGAVEAAGGRADRVAPVLERLREREKANDWALERLLEDAAR